MRTYEEIEARFKELSEGDEDFLGFQRTDLLCFLPVERARALLPGVVLVDGETPELTDEAIKKEMRDYLKFAFEKCVDHRGLSANRSVEHFRAWAWLLNDQELIDFVNNDANYPMYGAPVLRRVAEYVGHPLPEDPEFHHMADGRPCGGDHCAQGGGCE